MRLLSVQTLHSLPSATQNWPVTVSDASPTGLVRRTVLDTAALPSPAKPEGLLKLEAVTPASTVVQPVALTRRTRNKPESVCRVARVGQWEGREGRAQDVTWAARHIEHGA